MIKGVNKLIVEVANPDSEFFERAIFFVRPQMKDTSPAELGKSADALIRSRPVRESGQCRQSGRGKNPRLRVLSVFAFMGTAGLGAAIAVAVITIMS